MSAFLVSHDHIDALITAAAALPPIHSCPLPDGMTATAWGRVLLGECSASVRYRYEPESYQPDLDTFVIVLGYRYRPMAIGGATTRMLARAAEAVRCYQYQSCEHPGWTDSAAREWTDRLLGQLTRALSRMLAGDGAWGVDDRAYFTAGGAM